MSDYHSKKIKAPRLAGQKLRFVAGLVERAAGRLVLGGTLLKNAGIPELRAAIAGDAPTFAPDLGPCAPVRSLESAEILSALGPRSDASTTLESIEDFHQSYLEGRLTPLEVAERLLQVSRESDSSKPSMRFFIDQREGDVLDQARASTRRYESGTPRSFLDGVPVAIKDEVDQRGYPTTAGRAFVPPPAHDDATAVARLRAAGALLVGKTNMHEIGLGVTGINPNHGAARNPHSPNHATGGSSSGSAAAVAAGLCPVALAADGGGSIRIPAAFCGVVGLKPTFGRVSEHGAAPLCWSVAHIGPVGATVRDVALAYGVMAGPDPADPRSLRQPLPDLRRLDQASVQGLKIGVYRDWYEDADPEVVAACNKAIDKLVSCGAERVEIQIPELDLLRVVHVVTIISEMATGQHDVSDTSAYGGDVRLNLALARQLSAEDYLHAQRLRTRLNRHFDLALTKVDVIATPTSGALAPEISLDSLSQGESDLNLVTKIMRFAPAANLTGLPAISLPVGKQRGLPVGLQLMGRAWSESALLEIGAVLEPMIEREPPQVFYSLLR